MPIRERQRWFLKEWLKYREISQEKFRLHFGIAKSRMSALVNEKERWNSDHLFMFADELNIEPWELVHRNPYAPPPAGMDSIAETVQRIPLDERERALRAAQRMLEAFTVATPPSPSKPVVPRKKRA